jgi:hypothetical protein
MDGYHRLEIGHLSSYCPGRWPECSDLMYAVDHELLLVAKYFVAVLR